jgi:hypothetical protein
MSGAIESPATLKVLKPANDGSSSIILRREHNRLVDKIYKRFLADPEGEGGGVDESVYVEAWLQQVRILTDEIIQADRARRRQNYPQ